MRVEVTSGLLLEVIEERVREYQAVTLRVQASLREAGVLSGASIPAGSMLAVQDERDEDGTLRRYVVEVSQPQPVAPDAVHDADAAASPPVAPDLEHETADA